jgi:hypothetical protein
MLRTRVNRRDPALFNGERAPTAKSQCMRVVTNASGGTVTTFTRTNPGTASGGGQGV